MSLPVRAGPFQLHEPIGKGGMGEVWSGRHDPTGTPVAVKLLVAGPQVSSSELSASTAEPGSTGPSHSRPVSTGFEHSDRAFIEGFHREVRAVAGLDHPHVVVVYDHGHLGRDAQEATSGRLLAGTPWFAMELCTGGSLTELRGRLPWTELRAILLALLDGLAHAHARGVIHCDLKPSNVLFADRARPAATLKLTDFGIARLRGTDERAAGISAGTPRYMAPEQFRRDPRAQGPWTDLYALGCMAWALACARGPFRGRTLAELARSHLMEAPGTFQPVHPVPPGFEAWLRRLLDKDPAARFRRAADAAWALLGLAEQVGAAGGPPVAVPDADLATLVWSGHDAPTMAIAELAAPPFPGAGPARPIACPPVPRSWSRPVRRPSMLLGAGLGLFGLRQVPLVGRQDLQDRLWEALRACTAGQARVVALRGAPGTGKTRLARWLCERSDELGAAHPLIALHDPDGGPRSGLVPMLARDLGVEGLEGAALAERLAPVVGDAVVVRQLCALFTSGGAEGRVGRFATLAAHLVRRARERPVVLWLDDVHHSEESAAFAAALPERPDTARAPILVVLTLPEGPLPEGSAEPLRRLLARPGVESLAVGSLDAGGQAELVRGLLGFRGELAAAVEQRSEGNPQLAMQLVGNLVHRGALESTEHGFRLRPGEALELPSDVQAEWLSRLERGRLRERELQVVELLAVLGRDVPFVEWRGAARHRRLLIPPDLVDRLARVGVVSAHRDGLAFVHQALVEALRRRAIDAGRIEAHHLACARMIEERGGAIGRLGRHLLAAGRPLEAVGPLIEGAAQARWKFRDYRGSLGLLDDAGAALSRTGAAPGTDPREVVIGVQRVRCLRALGRYDQASAEMDRAVALARRCGWQEPLANALQTRGEVLRDLGRLSDARAQIEEALTVYTGLADEGGVTICRIELGYLAYHGGRYEEAEAHFRAALEIASRGAERDHADDAAYAVGLVCMMAGRGDEAEPLLRRAAEGYEARRDLLGLAGCANVLGGVYLDRGDHDQALAQYEIARAQYDAAGSPDVVLSWLNVARVQIDRTEPREALEALRRAEEVPGIEARPFLQGVVDTLRAAAAAQSADWALFDGAVAAATGAFSHTEKADPITPRIAVRAALAAESAGERDRAREAWLLAAQRWQALGDTEQATRARRAAEQPG